MASQTEISALASTSRPALEDIRHWFESDLGKHVLSTEKAMLDQLLPGLFGYDLMQLSVQSQPLFEASSIRHKVSVGFDESSTGGIVATPAGLPFADDSIDVVLMHHLLEFAANPQEILREVSRVTLPMGHVIFVGFNPLSSWGLWRSLAKYKARAPWTGDFIRPGRLMDWLNLLNFQIDRAQYDIYRPPLSRYLGKPSDYSKGFSRRLNLPIGSVYVIVARKHVGSYRTMRPVWKSEQRSFGRLSVVPSVKHDGVTQAAHKVQLTRIKPLGTDPE